MKPRRFWRDAPRPRLFKIVGLDHGYEWVIVHVVVGRRAAKNLRDFYNANRHREGTAVVREVFLTDSAPKVTPSLN